METELNKAQIKEFREKVNACFKELRRLGVKCRKNFTCCSTCGHHEISDGYDGSYVFYHLQESERLREGQDVVYLQHHIKDDIKPKVIEIIKRYGSDWDGDENKSIRISFISITEEKLIESKC